MDKSTIINKLENLVWKRFESKEKLDIYLSEEVFNISLVKEELKDAYDNNNKAYITELSEATKYDDQEEFDNNLLWTIADFRSKNEVEHIFCDFDIYYLIDNAKNIYITEVGYEFQ